MPDQATDHHEALRQLGAFMEEHGEHRHQIDIGTDGITLLCDSHSPPVYEILTMNSTAMRRAMGQELSESRAVSFH